MASDLSQRRYMRNRLITFILALLLLPPLALALTLSAQEWIAPLPMAGSVWLPALFSTLAVFAFSMLLDALTFQRTHHSLSRSQLSYLLWNGVAGAVTGMLLAYLNLFATTWATAAGSEVQALLVGALCGSVLLPAVSITRLWLAGLVRLRTRRFALPTLTAEPTAKLLLLLSLIGLLAGTVWVDHLFWMFWLSPLTLLVALQLLWHESTVFSGLPQGDWSRVLLGALSGILVGGIALATYRMSGGSLYLAISTWQLIPGLAVFGVLCLQISDVVAENWRGKKRSEVFKKKPFPIPIVTKKD